MKHLLLISSSVSHGSGYLGHCETQINDLLGQRSNVLFFPYAIHDEDGYTNKVRTRFEEMGYKLTSIHQAPDLADAIRRADAFFVGGGNTFRLLKNLAERGLIPLIQERVSQGIPYIGTSAGTNVACHSIRTTNDMPIVQPPSFDAIGLVPFNINPHYLDPDPDSKHKGETREERIVQFLEENDKVVVGLREGAMLRVDGKAIQLLGHKGARIFSRGNEPREVLPGADLSYLAS